MDTWRIAQCMAQLPRLTYFSHPESSLDDFFSGEANTIMNVDPQGQNSSRPAPHELQFLRCLSQSLGLGTHPSMANDGSAELGPYRRCGCASSSGHSSDLASHPRITADGSAMCQQLDNDRSVTSKSKADTSFSGPTTTPNSPSPPSIQAPATSSTALHVVSYAGRDERKSVQPPITTDVSSNSSTSRYQCNWEVSEQYPCGEWIEGGSKQVWIHVRTAHGLKGRYGGWCHCKWGGCLEKLKVSSLRRHLAKHMEIRWRCSGCDTVFSRYDYVRRHIRRSEECRGADCYSLGPGDSGMEGRT